jgi:hypothetical protein
MFLLIPRASRFCTKKMESSSREYLDPKTIGHLGTITPKKMVRKGLGQTYSF